MTDYQLAAKTFRRFLDAACERQLGFGGMDWVARAEQVKAGIAMQYGLTGSEMTAVLRQDDEGTLWVDDTGEFMDALLKRSVHAEVLG